MSAARPRACPGWLIAILLFALAPAAPARSNDVEICRALVAEHLDAEAVPDAAQCCLVAPGLPAINAVCPVQTASLLAHPWASLLARERDELTLADLEGLHDLYQSYRKGPTAPPLDRGTLADALAGLERPSAEVLSLWERVWRWVRGWWGDRERPEVDWLRGFSLSELTLQLMFYGSVALIVILALAVVFAELRAVVWTHRKRPAASWEDAGPGAAPALTLDTVRAAALPEQPGLLLRLLLEQLRARGMLRIAPGSTHRDITAAAGAMAGGQDLATLCHAAERAAFGGWRPGAAEIAGLYRACNRALHAVTASPPRGSADG